MPVIVLGVLVAAAAYELAVALGVIGFGSEPGAGPPGEGVVLACALGAMLAGALVSLWPRASFLGVLAPAGAAFLLARYYTFDPYYLPTLRRMSDGGLLPPWLVYGVAGLAAAAGLAVWARVPGGRLLTVTALLGSALLAFVAAGGH
jgi:hypothetical protein